MGPFVVVVPVIPVYVGKYSLVEQKKVNKIKNIPSDASRLSSPLRLFIRRPSFLLVVLRLEAVAWSEEASSWC
jgi:hypothetical protein